MAERAAIETFGLSRTYDGKVCALVGLDLSAGRITSAVALLAALGLLHGWLALSVGAATSSRALAIVVLAASSVLVERRDLETP